MAAVALTATLTPLAPLAPYLPLTQASLWHTLFQRKFFREK